jgi:hypothetical protein
MLDRRWLEHGVFISSLLCCGVPGNAAEVTEVATAADEVRIGNYAKSDPFDLHLDNTFSFVRDTGRIQREPIDVPGLPTTCTKDKPRACRPTDQLSYTRDTVAYGLRGQAGLYHDFALTFGWTYVARQTQQFGYAPGVTAATTTIDNPALGTLFAHDYASAHKGSGKLDLGLRWGVLSDVKDRSKPSWVLAVSWATPFAEQVYNPRAGASKDHVATVGDGVNYITFETALSKRLGQLGLIGIDPNANRRGYLEPYVDLSFVLPLAGQRTIPSLNPAATRPFASAPSYRGSFNAGFEVVPVEDLAQGRKVAIDLGLRTTYFAEGRNYSEVTDALGRPTWTDQYLYVGGVLGISAQVAGALRFKASFSVGTNTSHWLTGEQPGRDTTGDGLVTAADLQNEYYNSAYDGIGFRLRDDSHLSLGGSVSLMLTF